MNTKINVTVYAAKLRKKCEELKKKRVAALAQHKRDVADWRKAMVKWLMTNAEKKIATVSIEDMNGRRRDYLDSETFFAGCPEAPKRPEDKQIREIQALLHHLGITGQKTIQVETSDVAKYLGERYTDDDY